MSKFKQFLGSNEYKKWNYTILNYIERYDLKFY